MVFKVLVLTRLGSFCGLCLLDVGSSPQVREQRFYDRVETVVLRFLFLNLLCMHCLETRFRCWTFPECLLIIIKARSTSLKSNEFET